MKILFGMPSADSWGGPAACEPPFVEAIENLGVDIATEEYVYGDRDKTTPLLTRIVRVIKTAMRFRQRLARERFDLIHLNTAFDRNTVLRDSLSLFLMGRKRPKVFLKIHGSGAHLIPTNSYLFKRLIKFLDARVAGYGIFTREELDTFTPHGLDPAKFYFVKNAVSPRKAAPFARSKGKEPGDNFELLFVSRFVATKGLLETVNAVHRLRANGVNFTLTCIGDGPIKDEAQKLVRDLGMTDIVSFTGYITEDEVDGHLKRADIFVFPTRHNEGFPIALFKAALAGLPIVTTSVRAAAEYFEDRKNCLFCSTDPEDIANKINELINDRAMREQMSAENQEFGKMLAPESVANEYFTIYETILNK